MGFLGSRVLPAVRRPTIFLHIGAMKTGTTYLQGLMHTNRERLLDAGYLFPGDRWQVQSRAVRDVMGFSLEDPRRAAETVGRWDAVSREMLDFRGRASVMSMEFLSFADVEQATRITESLAGAKVHVILTVRDATTAIPTQWQTGCRNGKRLTLPQFLSGVSDVLDAGEDAQSKGARLILRTQWAPRMLDTWVPLLGPDNVHVISLPPRTADPRELWNRFAAVTGIPPEACADTELDSNPSLGLASTELLRRLNAQVRDVPSYDYEMVVKRRVAREILTTRKSREQPIALNKRGHRLARRWNRATRRAIEEHGVSWGGDPDELPPAIETDDLPKKLPLPSDDELLAAAATACDGMRGWLEQTATALRTGDRELGVGRLEWSPPAEADADLIPDVWRRSEDPVASAVTELAGLVRQGVSCFREVQALPGSEAV